MGFVISDQNTLKSSEKSSSLFVVWKCKWNSKHCYTFLTFKNTSLYRSNVN